MLLFPTLCPFVCSFAAVQSTHLPVTLSGQFPLGLDTSPVPRCAHGSNDTAAATRKGLLTQETRNFVQELLRNNSVPGLSVAIVRADAAHETDSESGNWGRRSDNGDPTTPETLFTLASVSKAFLATSLGILIEDYARGAGPVPLPPGVAFSWKTKVKDLLHASTTPSDRKWRLMDDWAFEKASLGDILSHVSGLPGHDFSYRPNDTYADLVARMQYLRPGFELREQFSYNNQMYMLAAHIISVYSALPYAKFLSTRLLIPLNMSSTTLSPQEALNTGQFSESWTPEGRAIPRWFLRKGELNEGPGGVVSSAADLARWMRALLAVWSDEGESEDIAGIPRAALLAPMQARVLLDGAPAGKGDTWNVAYGYGWQHKIWRGHHMVTHAGAIPGISTRLALFPTVGLGIALLANADAKDAVLQKVWERLAGMVFGGEVAEDLDSSQSVDDDLIISPPTPRGSNSDPQPASSTTMAHWLPLSAYAGTYSDLGYGTLTLCAPSSISTYCSHVLADFAAVDGATASASEKRRNEQTQKVEELYAAYPRMWTTHVRFTRRRDVDAGGHIFDIVFTALFPAGYGSDTRPFETYEAGTSEGVASFVVDEEDGASGFGVEDLTRGGTDRARWGRSAQKRAEVWFSKGG